jgi:ferric-dicitrate binding protein FerR (iron transport regulator)
MLFVSLDPGPKHKRGKAMNAEMREELQRLLAELCDGQLNEAEHARLQELLDADAECRRLYLEYLDLHARLLTHSALGSGAMPSAYPLEAAARRRRTVSVLRYVVVAVGTLAASLLIQWSLSWWPGGGASPPTEAQAPAYVATLVQAAGCVWEGENQPRAGARLALGELRLRKGAARIVADGGSALLLEGPVVLRLDSGTSATLLQGKVVFQADETAAPFDLHTPTATLVDFGTEYAVAVGPDGEEVHVFNGEVRRTLNGEGDDGLVEQLTAGQARRYAPAAQAPGQPVPLDEERFIRHLADVEEADGDPAAGLLAYEGFDYKDAEAFRRKQANGGFGWNGPWEGFARPLRPGDTNHHALHIAESLSRPGSATPSVGGCFEYLGFSKYYRRLATPVRLDIDRTYYLSFLFRRQGPPADPLNAVAVLLRTNSEIRNENSRLRLNIGVGGANQLFTHLHAVGSRTPLPLDYGTTYLLATKIIARATEPDQVFLRVYGAQEAVERREPETWTVTGPPFQSDLVFEWLEVHINSLTRQTIDEVRLGTTWASVAAPWLMR